VWLATLQVNAPERVLTAPDVSLSLDARLGDWETLLGADMPKNVAAGQGLKIALVWHARGGTDQDYKVFVHLLSADGRVLAQSDAVPAGWSRPTSGWLAGEYVTDVHSIEVKRDVPPGDYRLVTGMYDSATGKRLLLPTGQDVVSLGMVQVTPQ
jgi:hypothetical protein